MTPHAFAAIDCPAELIMIFDREGQRAHVHHETGGHLTMYSSLDSTFPTAPVDDPSGTGRRYPGRGYISSSKRRWNCSGHIWPSVSTIIQGRGAVLATMHPS